MTWHIIDEEIEKSSTGQDTKSNSCAHLYKNVSFMTRFGPTLETKLFSLKTFRLYHYCKFVFKILANLNLWNSNDF